MPRSLREEWSTISERQYRAQKVLLRSKRTLLEEYLERMKLAQYQNQGHQTNVEHTLQSIDTWFTALETLRNAGISGHASGTIRLVNQEGNFIKKKVRDRAYFETGILDIDWRLGDIRKKRFVNCGIQCSACKNHESDHPQLVGCGLYEIFSSYVGPKMSDQTKWCEICVKQRFFRKASHHRTDQHDLGMWYDHPANDEQALGQYDD